MKRYKKNKIVEFSSSQPLKYQIDIEAYKYIGEEFN